MTPVPGADAQRPGRRVGEGVRERLQSGSVLGGQVREIGGIAGGNETPGGAPSRSRMRGRSRGRSPQLDACSLGPMVQPGQGLQVHQCRWRGEDVFVHFTAIESNGYRSLDENQRVEFDMAQGQKGPQAEHVNSL
jgi:cold shock CspA family protein